MKTLSMQQAHYEKLNAHFFSDSNFKERAATLLLGHVDGGGGQRSYTVLEAEIIDDAALLSSSARHVTWDNNAVLPVFRMAAQHSLTPAIVHSHNAPARFSEVDDEGEHGLAELLRHRNGHGAELVSLVLGAAGDASARGWASSGSFPIDRLRIVGERFDFRVLGARSDHVHGEAFARQSLVFGPVFISTLQQMTATVVGCGGTGSAVAMLLARIGLGKINLIDSDVVEATNLNRLHGATIKDAEARRPKVDVVGRSLSDMGLGAEITTFNCLVSHRSCRTALKQSDVIFGCTDDHSGRIFLNRFAYFYLVPVLDTGLAIEVSRGDYPKITALDGRVTVLGPGNVCLICRGIVSSERARAEDLFRSNPKEFERLRQEAYVIGEGNPNPSVVTFTTEVATMAMNEFLHRLQGFRGSQGAISQITRLFHRMHDLRPGEKSRPDCPICASSMYWGRADVEPFLDQVW